MAVGCSHTCLVGRFRFQAQKFSNQSSKALVNDYVNPQSCMLAVGGNVPFIQFKPVCIESAPKSSVGLRHSLLTKYPESNTVKTQLSAHVIEKRRFNCCQKQV